MFEEFERGLESNFNMLLFSFISQYVNTNAYYANTVNNLSFCRNMKRTAPTFP